MITADQVRAARAAGYAAGRALEPADANPYARYVPSWSRPRDPGQARRLEREQRDAARLARVWLAGWRAGLDEHAAQRAAGGR